MSDLTSGKTRSPRFALLAVCGMVASLGLAGSASAQVAYSRPAPFDPFLSPYDEVYGTSPSFEIYPRAYGAAPAVRVVERCQYPDGWNATDFSRDVNGVPAGLDHTCPAEPSGVWPSGVRAR